MITRNSKYGVFGNTTMSGSKESEWQVAVALGKVLVSQYKDIRKQVVDLAKSVCVIHHGGKSVDERYTLKSFAIDIGIPPKTLSEWYRIYTNVYENLPEKDRNKMSYNTLRHIDKKLKGVDRNSSTFPKKVKEASESIKGETQSTIKMKKYLLVLKSVDFNVSNEQMIKDCDSDVLMEILMTAEKIVFDLKNSKVFGK